MFAAIAKMKTLPLTAIALLVAPLLWAAPAAAFPCSGPAKAEFKTVCADVELAGLDEAVDARFKRLVASADPLTALLLKRDQQWFTDILGARNMAPFKDDGDPERSRMVAALRGRAIMLDRMDTGTPRQNPVGEWANTFGTAKVEISPDGTLRVGIASKVTYADNEEPIACALSAQAKLAGDGWFTGKAQNSAIADDRDPDQTARSESPFELRLRLQGRTLRVVLLPDEQDSPCSAPEQVTGSYFPVGVAEAGSPDSKRASRTVAPSFDCATAKNSDEEEICADPDLARQDAAIARIYRDVLRRLDPKASNYLRDDQRTWVKTNATVFDIQLHPSWDKQRYFVHQTGNARNELMLRLGERAAMLANLDEKRKGLEGLWVAHNALLTILPD
jgi:uncharacterized protein